MTTGYVGRFAPSVTGPLHFGSLLAALASYLDARANNGRWLLRLDDLDVPRNVPGADRDILDALEHHALEWDGPVTRQSEHIDAYRAAFSQLIDTGCLFLCSCSRRSLRGLTSYPGTCRSRVLHSEAEAGAAAGQAAVRIRVPAARFAFVDEVFGPQGEALDAHPGDFIVRRRDGLFAYQLAVVVDDAAAQVSHVVRGADLLDNTPRQLYLMDQLGLYPPTYAHFPVIIDRTGAKLSKQTFARAITPHDATVNLHLALALLGQEPAPELLHAAPEVLLAWARAHWSLDQVPATPHFPDFVSI